LPSFPTRRSSDLEHADRDGRAERAQPGGCLPFARRDRHRETHERDHHAVPEREEQPAPAARAFARAGARQAVDGHEVVRVEAVAQPEQEHQQGEAERVRGQAAHRFASPRMKRSSHSLFHLSCSSSTVTGSTTVYSKSLRCVRTLVLAGTLPIDTSSACPSGDSTKSTKARAAFGLGALRATAIPCGRATTGCTGSQSIGAPFRFMLSALALYTVSPTWISPAAISSASSTWPLRTSGLSSASLRKCATPASPPHFLTSVAIHSASVASMPMRPFHFGSRKPR